MKNKIVLMLLVGMIAVSTTACGGSAEETKEEPKVNVEDVDDDIKEEKEEVKSEVPGIKGSQVYDIVKSLADTGIPEADSNTTSDGFQFDSTTDKYAYSISTNSDHEVMSAQFFVFAPTDDEGYLGFCASMPYDEASPDAMQWVNDNAGSEAEITFGDAIYQLSVGEQGPILTIKSVDYDKYMMDVLMNN